MKVMPLPCEFQGKGVLDIAELSSDLFLKWNKQGHFVGIEPTSVLDSTRSPSPPTSSSTPSSGGGNCWSGGGGASTDTTGVAAVYGTPSPDWALLQQQQDTNNGSNVAVESAADGGLRKEEWGVDLQPSFSTFDVGVAAKCGLGMVEDWASILSESAPSPSQEQSVLRLTMGDVDYQSLGLNKLLQSGCYSETNFNGAYGAVDQAFGVHNPSAGGNLTLTNNHSLPLLGFTNGGTNNILTSSGKMGSVLNSKTPNPFLSSSSPAHLLPGSVFPGVFHQQPVESVDEKSQVFNPLFLTNQHQIESPQNPSFILPNTQQEHLLLLPLQQKRSISGVNGPNMKQPIFDSEQEFARRQMLLLQQQQQPQSFGHQFHLLPHDLCQRPSMNPKMVGEEIGHNQHLQQAVIDQLYNAAELLETGNLVLAQGILARLNHQLSSIGKPFQRAAFYFKEALQQLLHVNNASASPHLSPFTLISRIEAYKSFSEISPIVQFANFTCVQALLEVLEGCDRIHILDFDIGYGGQWASLMQELALRNGGISVLKITAFASAATHSELELGLARENLSHFASEINIAFDFEIVSLDTLDSASWSIPFHVSEDEAITVNLPSGCSLNYSLSLPLVLPFVKRLSPKIVVSLDKSYERADLSFPHHIINALQSHLTLLESLDAVNVNMDALQKIERFLLYPDIEKVILRSHRSLEKMLPWRTLFLSHGFSQLTFSNLAESQAECVVKRTPVRGFHVERRGSSLVLCWQRKELISVSAWRC